MPRFAANLTMMFTEHAFLDRFGAAADAGFTAVEFLFPYAETVDAVASRVRRHDFAVALFNLPPGDWAAGERGTAALAGREADAARALETALPYAEALGVRRLHLMAGIADRADPRAAATYRDAVARTADALAPRDLDLVLEPINGRDMPGYFLDDFAYASELIGALARPNLKLQFDLYHRQIMHGDVARALASALPIVGHVQVASVPSRHEPDGEELNHPFLFDELDRLGYAGFVGCEYRPRGRTEDGLAWFAPWAGARA